MSCVSRARSAVSSFGLIRVGDAMRVKTWKTIDIECDVDVSFDDVLAEFLERTAHGGSRLVLAMLNDMTRILQRIPDEVIVAMPLEAQQEVRRRLDVEARRYAKP